MVKTRRMCLRWGHCYTQASDFKIAILTDYFSKISILIHIQYFFSSNDSWAWLPSALQYQYNRDVSQLLWETKITGRHCYMILELFRISISGCIYFINNFFFLKKKV